MGMRRLISRWPWGGFEFYILGVLLVSRGLDLENTEKSHSRKWFERAQEDFVHAEFSAEHEDWNWAQLACQQAAEKALKSVCIRRGLGLSKTHDLAGLARKLEAPKSVVEHCALLNPFYTASRYPDLEPSNDESLQRMATEHALEAAREVLAWCKPNIFA